MKYLKAIKNNGFWIFLIPFTICFIGSSCSSQNEDEPAVEDSIEPLPPFQWEHNGNIYENISSPLTLHYVNRSGMDYMITSANMNGTGVEICNLTLDSLMVEYYRKQLSPE